MSSHKFCLLSKDNDFGTMTDFTIVDTHKLRICQEHTCTDISDHVNAISIWLHNHKFLFTESYKIVPLQTFNVRPSGQPFQTMKEIPYFTNFIKCFNVYNVC